jgi:hypothetical protein
MDSKEGKKGLWAELSRTQCRRGSGGKDNEKRRAALRETDTGAIADPLTKARSFNGKSLNLRVLSSRPSRLGRSNQLTQPLLVDWLDANKLHAKFPAARPADYGKDHEQGSLVPGHVNEQAKKFALVDRDRTAGSASGLG